jgi:hypothetical protein
MNHRHAQCNPAQGVRADRTITAGQGSDRLRRRRSERQAKTDFPCSLRDQIRQQAVQAKRRQEQPEASKGTETSAFSRSCARLSTIHSSEGKQKPEKSFR